MNAPEKKRPFAPVPEKFKGEEPLASEIVPTTEHTSHLDAPAGESKFSAAEFIKFLCAMLTVFRDFAGIGWAIPPDMHGRVIPVSGLPLWIQKRFHDLDYEPPSSQLIAKRLAALESLARFGDTVTDVCKRVGGYATDFFIDLGDAFVHVRDGVWSIVTETPIVFQAHPTSAVLTHPARGGSVTLLRRFLNIESDDHFLLIITYIAYLLTPRTQFPILVLMGEQGSGKSTVADIVQSLVDGWINRRGSLPESERDLAICAMNALVLCFDNVSRITNKMADCLCRIATGGTFSVRKLYSNNENTVFRLSNPVIVTCINLVSDLADFLSRCLIIELPYLSDEDRGRTDTEFWAEFEEDRPRIFGAILDLAAKAVALEPGIRLPRYHRMSDFVRFGEAVARALDMPEGSFLRAFELNEDRAAHAALDNPLATAIQRLLTESGVFHGTPTQLLHELRACWPLGQGAPPGSPKSLSAQLSRIAQPLRHVGISVDSGKSGERWIHLETTVHASATDDPAANAWATSRTMLDLLDSDSESEDSHELIYS